MKMKKKFNRSEYMKNLHAEAKQQRSYFINNFGETKTPSYSQFLKGETPLNTNIVTYEVSYQLNYTSEFNALIIKPQTFKVVAFEGQEDEIMNKTIEMVKDSKGKNSKAHFNDGALGVINDGLDVKVKRISYPRGMEKSQKKPTREEIQNLIRSGSSISQIDGTVSFTNKKGRSGKMEMDLRHF